MFLAPTSSSTSFRHYFLTSPLLPDHLGSVQVLLTRTAGVLSCGELITLIVDESRRREKHVDDLECELAGLLGCQLAEGMAQWCAAGSLRPPSLAPNLPPSASHLKRPNRTRLRSTTLVRSTTTTSTSSKPLSCAAAALSPPSSSSPYPPSCAPPFREHSIFGALMTVPYRRMTAGPCRPRGLRAHCIGSRARPAL
jgi:hypothetical protein